MTDRPNDPDDATDASPTTRYDAPAPAPEPAPEPTAPEPAPEPTEPEPEPTETPAQPAAAEDIDPAAATPLEAPPAPPPLAVPPPPPVTPPPAPSSGQPWPPPSWGRRSDDPGRLGTIILGVILLAIGLWFFADQTLELDMPNLRWSQLWPILIIGFGAWIAIGSMRRR
jgi:uncharacterized membrane protein